MCQAWTSYTDLGLAGLKKRAAGLSRMSFGPRQAGLFLWRTIVIEQIGRCDLPVDSDW